MKRSPPASPAGARPRLASEPPPGLTAYELEPGQFLFVHALPSAPQLAQLAPSEQEVLVLVLEGQSTAAIARARGTSPRTTANQIAAIFKKVGVRSRAELAAKLIA